MQEAMTLGYKVQLTEYWYPTNLISGFWYINGKGKGKGRKKSWVSNFRNLDAALRGGLGIITVCVCMTRSGDDWWLNLLIFVDQVVSPVFRSTLGCDVISFLLNFTWEWMNGVSEMIIVTIFAENRGFKGNDHLEIRQCKYAKASTGAWGGLAMIAKIAVWSSFY